VTDLTYTVVVRTDDAETLDHYPWLKKHSYLHDAHLPLPAVGDVFCFTEPGSTMKNNNFLRVIGREFWLPEGKPQHWALVVSLLDGDRKGVKDAA